MASAVLGPGDLVPFLWLARALLPFALRADTTSAPGASEATTKVGAEREGHC